MIQFFKNLYFSIKYFFFPQQMRNETRTTIYNSWQIITKNFEEFMQNLQDIELGVKTKHYRRIKEKKRNEIKEMENKKELYNLVNIDINKFEARFPKEEPGYYKETWNKMKASIQAIKDELETGNAAVYEYDAQLIALLIEIKNEKYDPLWIKSFCSRLCFPDIRDKADEWVRLYVSGEVKARMQHPDLNEQREWTLALSAECEKLRKEFKDLQENFEKKVNEKLEEQEKKMLEYSTNQYQATTDLMNKIAELEKKYDEKEKKQDERLLKIEQERNPYKGQFKIEKNRLDKDDSQARSWASTLTLGVFGK